MVFGKRTIASLSLTFLFLVSSVYAPSAVAFAKGASAPLAATPLSSQEANWASPNGNQFAQDYNPQTQINSSSVPYLGISWLFPLPSHPSGLLSVSGGLGVDTAPLIVNGTIYMITQFAQVFALNAANGNVLWTDVLPILPNSTAGKGITSLSLHLHDGDEAFTTKLFGNTPTFWISAPDQHIYAINALNGKFELNFSHFAGISTVQGNNPTSLYTGTAPNLLVDENKGIVITSIMSGSSPATGRCFFRGWNVLVTPPKMVWETYCTPPQPGGNLPIDASWTIKQVNSMKGAQIFNPGPAYNNGGPIPGSAVVDLKKLSASQLNATLYDDWGYVNQTPACKAYTGGSSTGSTAAGWGGAFVLGSGPTAGYAFVATNNPDPYNSPCTPGPELWAAAVLALNDTNGNWIWGFQTSAHDLWDLDCSWWQALGNETVNGAPTQVLWKLCKNGYMYELNAVNGNMIWAYTPPITAIPRCQYCYMLNALNRTQMTLPFMNPSLQPTLFYPGAAVGEMEAAYSPALNYVFFADEDIPIMGVYVAPNSSNYRTSPGMALQGVGGAPLLGNGPNPKNNATVVAVDASTGNLVWSYFIATQGYRGGLTTSGNIVFLAESSGDLVLLNAQTGKLIRDIFIGGPLNVLPSIGATAGGKMEVIVPITAGIVTWGAAVPGDIVALSLQNIPGGGLTSTVTSATTVTVAAQTSIITTTAGGTGIDPSTFYGVAAIAVIFVIATGFFAMRGRRKPAP